MRCRDLVPDERAARGPLAPTLSPVPGTGRGHAARSDEDVSEAETGLGTQTAMQVLTATRGPAHGTVHTKTYPSSQKVPLDLAVAHTPPQPGDPRPPPGLEPALVTGASCPHSLSGEPGGSRVWPASVGRFPALPISPSPSLGTSRPPSQEASSHSSQGGRTRQPNSVNASALLRGSWGA